MKKSRKVLILTILVLAALVFLTAGVCIVWWQYSLKTTEVLVVWGVIDNRCTIQIIDPNSQQVLNTTEGETDCFYDMIESIEANWLIHVQLMPTRITFLSIDARGHTSVEYEIVASDMKLTSQPQLAPGNLIYVSGVVDGQEQIYRFDITSGQRDQITDLNFMAFEPVVSPDGTYVAYLIDERGLYRDPYYEGSSTQYYYVRNLETGEDAALAPFADLPDHENCRLNWSPIGGIAVFEAGCFYTTTPTQLVVVDVENNTLLGKIDPISKYSPHVWFTEWVDETNIAYCSKAEHPPEAQSPYLYNRCFVYDISSQESAEIKLLSLLGMPFAPYYLESVDWMDAEVGRQLVARIIDANAKNSNSVISSTLVTMSMDDGLTTLHLLDLGEVSDQGWKAELEPIWSPSGSWIAYYNGVELGVVDGSGTKAYSIVSFEDFPELDYAWLRLNNQP